MVEITKFIKEHALLCAGTLGLAVVGYLGYHAILWILEKSELIKKIDSIAKAIFGTRQPQQVPTVKTRWWSKITQSNEFKDFKKNWKNIALSESERETAALKLLHAYKPGVVDQSKAPRNELLGEISWVPGNVEFWMPGVALVAAYLAEKKKIEGLYVCSTLESLKDKIKEISNNPKDQRLAFVVGTIGSGWIQQSPDLFEPNFPQHKVTVCIEKKEGKLAVCLLDPQPLAGSNDYVIPSNLEGDLWDGYDQWYRFNSQELIFRAVMAACKETNAEARLVYSRVLRQMSYGCAIYALQDAMAFLRDPQFFQKITCDQDRSVKVDERYTVEAIAKLPPEYMVGTQSNRTLEEFRFRGGQFNEPLPGKKKSLQYYLDKYLMDVPGNDGTIKKQNHFITKKLFKYMTLAALASKLLKPEEINQIIAKTMIA